MLFAANEDHLAAACVAIVGEFYAEFSGATERKNDRDVRIIDVK